MLRGLFARRLGGDVAGPAASERVKAAVRAALGEDAASGFVTMASEIDCADPGCPGLETVILLMPPGGKGRAVKVGKPMAEVTEQDVAAALADAGFEVTR